MNFREHIEQSFKVDKNKKHNKFDWLGIVVFASVALAAGILLVVAIGKFTHENDLRAADQQIKSQREQFKRNAEKEWNTPQRTYKQAKEALENNDLEGVLETIHPESRWQYEEDLRQMAEEGRLPEAVERMTPLTQVASGDPNDTDIGAYVVYETEPIPGNDSSNPLEGYRETVEFMRDKNGIWKINSI